MRRGGAVVARSASPAPRAGPAAASAQGVVADGARGEVWRAVALQAHMMGGGSGARGRGRSLGPSRPQRSSSGMAASVRSSSGGTSGGRGHAVAAASTPAASTPASRSRAHCPATGTDLAELDYEEKLRRHQASLTLAQRMGLVPEPSAPLSAAQWEAVKRASDAREDSDAPCSICLEDFRERPQVILSCSHVFHGECLQSFERFAGSRRCPLCRKASYDATPHWGGFMIWRNKCASRIQKAWRGHRSRVDVYSRLKQPDVRSEAPALHRRFCQRALHVVGDKLQKACDDREDAIDRFLSELDGSLAQCSEQLRDGLLGFERLHGPNAGASLDTTTIGSTRDVSPAMSAATATSEGGSHAVPRMANSTAVDSGKVCVDAETWAKARRAALNRGEEEDCPICFQPCQLRGRGGARVELLSCSHVFHRCCIMSFESFHVFEIHVCPVCRQAYERRPWQQPATGAIAPGLSADARPPRPPGVGSASNIRALPARAGSGQGGVGRGRPRP